MEDPDILIIVDAIFEGNVEAVVLALAEPDILEKDAIIIVKDSNQQVKLF